MLVDADNVTARRLQPVLDLLVERAVAARIVASGRPGVLRRVRWPAGTELRGAAGWQRADLALADAYVPDAYPLLLVSGDGDFGLLATRHPGPVLVVSGAASTRLREGTTVVDPAADGVATIEHWLAAHLPAP